MKNKIYIVSILFIILITGITGYFDKTNKDMIKENETLNTTVISTITDDISNDIISDEEIDETAVDVSISDDTKSIEATAANIDKQIDSYIENIKEKKAKYAKAEGIVNYLGRLYIDRVGLDVAIYNTTIFDSIDINPKGQAVADRLDSAACIDHEKQNGIPGGTSPLIIADHSNQEFRVLPKVVVGDTLRICMKNGNTYTYKCTNTLHGHNTGTDLTDANYNSIINKACLTLYTCENGWKNIKVCQFERIS